MRCIPLRKCIILSKGKDIILAGPQCFYDLPDATFGQVSKKIEKNAICNFCDTDFVGNNGPGGGKFNTADNLARHTLQFWPLKSESKPYVVCTGGEPLLQIDRAFVGAFHNIGFEIAIETNGTILPPNGIDWVCVSPKIGSKLVLIKRTRIKISISSVRW